MPLAPPVINATLFARRIRSSCLFEISFPLPVRYNRIELPLFGAQEVEIVVHNFRAEGFACQRTALEDIYCVAQAAWNAGQIVRLIDVAGERRRRFDAVVTDWEKSRFFERI